jgi:hypothetical protein
MGKMKFGNFVKMSFVVGFALLAAMACQDKDSTSPAGSKQKNTGIAISKDTRIQKNVNQFSDLLNAAKCYMDKGLDLNNLYPLTAEKASCLDKSYGGFEKPARNFNWTEEGGWLGIWGNTNKIGVGIVGSYDNIKPALDKYKAQAEEIFFPYPKRLLPKEKVSPDSNGQLIMVFPKNVVVGLEK